MKTNPTVQEIAKTFGCSTGQVQRQFIKNAAHVRTVIAKLESGKPAGDYKSSDIPMLRSAAENYEAKALL